MKKIITKIAVISTALFVMTGCVENKYTVVKPDGSTSIVEYYESDISPDRVFLDNEYVGIASHNITVSSNTLSQAIITVGEDTVVVDCKEFSINSNAEVVCDTREVTSSTVDAIPVGSVLKYGKGVYETKH